MEITEDLIWAIILMAAAIIPSIDIRRHFRSLEKDPPERM